MAISPMAINPTRTQITQVMQNSHNQMSKLKQAGIKSIELDGKYIKIKGINRNTLLFTKEGAMKFLKNLLVK